MSVLKQLSPAITRSFAGHCPMSGVNIKTCSYLQWKELRKIDFLYRRKINVKKLHSKIHFNSAVSGWRESLAFIMYQPHLNCLAKSPTIRILFRKISRIYLHSYHFTLQHYFSYGHAVYIHSKYLKIGSFGRSICRRSRTSLK